MRQNLQQGFTSVVILGLINLTQHIEIQKHRFPDNVQPSDMSICSEHVQLKPVYNNNNQGFTYNVINLLVLKDTFLYPSRNLKCVSLKPS